MEVPDSVVKHVPDEYEVTSQKKGSRRYRTPLIDGLLSELTDAEDRRDAAQRDTMRRIFFQFDRQYVSLNWRLLHLSLHYRILNPCGMLCLILSVLPHQCYSSEVDSKLFAHLYQQSY